jgi:pimeloyl-ACP methyl ester carboxylesterase
MNTITTTTTDDPFVGFPMMGWVNEVMEYTWDAWQRALLFVDTIRQQGTDFIEENEKGLPPVIDFDYEIICDGRQLDRPVNYSLARILPEKGVVIRDDARPVIIIDPRAGHGPGVGAMKKESAVGVAMKNSHPVYFMMFSQFPVPGQTLADVVNAQIQFIEEVGRLHSGADKPAVIGNCQAGWATALLAADRPDITGPLFLNGSPLSYWAGKDVRNPIRYKGGMLGGIWTSSLYADLGNGFFDGANLVKNFEDLNPANTWWKKKYNLYANIDTERDRFLHFEKWWNGFFFLSAEEIRFITRDLFVGNKLEAGEVSFENGRTIDLKNLKDPIFVFASEGDNITAPQQALNWVMRVWGTVDDIKQAGQVIVYLLHKDIGHLGIFVSSKVVNREHTAMIGHVDLVHYLSPGLYEMVIDDSRTNEQGEPDVRFEARDFEHIMDLNEPRGELEFKYVSRLSEINDGLYRGLFSPFVRMFTNRFTAEMFWRSHPLRYERYLLSDLNPAFIPVKTLAPTVRQRRRPASPDNVYRRIEASVADSIAAWFDYYRDMRDLMHYQTFYLIYDHPVMPLLFGGDERKRENDGRKRRRSFRKYRVHSNTGGMAEGLFRGLMALNAKKKVSHKNQLEFIRDLIKASRYLVNLDKDEIGRIISRQAKILRSDFDLAIETIPELITSPEDRLVAIHILSRSVEDSQQVEPEEQALLDRLIALLDDRKTLS